MADQNDPTHGGPSLRQKAFGGVILMGCLTVFILLAWCVVQSTLILLGHPVLIER